MGFLKQNLLQRPVTQFYQFFSRFKKIRLLNSLVPWCNGAEPNGAEPNGADPNGADPNGAMVRWCDGAMVRWCVGVMVRWCDGVR